jgi:hypothetical protein
VTTCLGVQTIALTSASGCIYYDGSPC